MADTILYYDCFAGISGDMNLAAMLDLGVPEAHLRAELARLPLSGYSLRVTRDARKGITGTRVDVDVPESAQSHHHSSWRDVRELIEGSALTDSVKARATDMFQRLAEAEARVHGTSVDEVHFHEVGAVDSIVDIVGAAICLEYLRPARVVASSIELGGGFVRSQHGMLPVPAPATAILLTGVPTKSGAVPFEMTTPTGAAILAHSVGSFSEDKRFVIRKVGYGVGHRDTEIPNLLRLFLADADGRPGEEARLVECNIDDMNPEISTYLLDLLFEAGASDVFFTPIVMKKSRPAVTLSVLCPPAMEAAIIEPHPTGDYDVRPALHNRVQDGPGTRRTYHHDPPWRCSRQDWQGPGKTTQGKTRVRGLQKDSTRARHAASGSPGNRPARRRQPAMRESALRELLLQFSSGQLPVDSAFEQLRGFPLLELPYATIDTQREARVGYPEVVYCEGKRPASFAESQRAARMLRTADPVPPHDDEHIVIRAERKADERDPRALSCRFSTARAVEDEVNKPGDVRIRQTLLFDECAMHKRSGHRGQDELDVRVGRQFAPRDCQTEEFTRAARFLPLEH